VSLRRAGLLPAMLLLWVGLVPAPAAAEPPTIAVLDFEIEDDTAAQGGPSDAVAHARRLRTAADILRADLAQGDRLQVMDIGPALDLMERTRALQALHQCNGCEIEIAGLRHPAEERLLATDAAARGTARRDPRASRGSGSAARSPRPIHRIGRRGDARSAGLGDHRCQPGPGRGRDPRPADARASSPCRPTRPRRRWASSSAEAALPSACQRRPASTSGSVRRSTSVQSSISVVEGGLSRGILRDYLSIHATAQ